MNQPKEKQENFLLNILLNIAIPTIILIKFSGEEHLGPKLGIVVALAFPIIYGIMDFGRAKKVNFFSILGVVSILFTGGISLLELDPKYIAIKEAAIPALFGIATIGSLFTRYPLVKTFLYNDKVMQIDRVNQALEQRENVAAFQATLTNASYMIAASFFLSSVLNYVLAKMILVSPPGTEEFNAELGKMTALSYPVIALPAMLIMFATLFYLFRSITHLTKLSWEEILNDPQHSKNTDNNSEAERQE